MATRSQIDRLAQRIEQVAGELEARRPRLVAQIIQQPDETKEAAMERYFADHPENRQATDFIIIKIVDPIDEVCTRVRARTSWGSTENAAPSPSLWSPHQARHTLPGPRPRAWRPLPSAWWRQHRPDGRGEATHI